MAPLISANNLSPRSAMLSDDGYGDGHGDIDYNFIDYDDNYTYISNYTDNENYTYFNWDMDGNGLKLRPATIVSIAMYTVTFLVGVPGNLAVLWVAGFRMKRTVNSVWFLHLAAADLAYCCSLPFQIANVALANRWPSHDLLCKLIPSAIVLNMSASVFLLTLVSIDRCLAVTRPVWAQRHRTVCRARAACAVAWLLALLMCLPTLLNRQVVTHPGLGFSYCSLDYSRAYFRERTKAVVETTRALLAFALPFLIMAACYLRIVQTVRGARFAKSHKPMRLVAAVVVAFFVCWLPYHVFGLLQAFAPSLQAALTWDFAAVGLASVNSALNPPLYVFVGRDFRQRFRRSLATTLRIAFSEDPSQSVNSTRLKSRSSLGESV
uniref:C3a anaphylatoxin chemotactic receptor-like isoform X1 n=2 Tax=Pristiophorus japonicus TaxID=55135 RepID=UPI00398F1110